MAQAPRVMIVSPQKTGTHLMLEMALALGYKVFGAIRASERTEPRFDIEQRLRLARLVFSDSDVRELERLKGTERFIERTDEAWSALAWSWQRRLGQPVANRYGQAKHDSVDLIATNPRLSETSFADTPPGMAWIWHELAVRDIDGDFVREWFDTGEPRIIFNYRDPRDVLLSLINFVDGKTPESFGNFYERRIYSALIGQYGSMSEKIDYALSDPYFLARGEFEKCFWMLHHPAVCKVRYEDLVGVEGGGSKKRQLAAVERVLDHLDADIAPEVVCRQLYNKNSWSFRVGRPGAWKTAFSAANLCRFSAVHGDLLEQYGYE